MLSVVLFHGFIHTSSILLNIINKYYYYNAMLCLIMLSSFSVNSVQQMCSFFCPFFPWSFWSSSTLPQLVVLRCIVLRFAVCFVLRCLVLCCVVL